MDKQRSVKMQGFAAYDCQEDGKITDSEGNVVAANKKGMVSLKGDDDKNANFLVSDIIDVVKATIEEEDKLAAEKAADQEKKVAKKSKNELAEKLAELKANLTLATKRMLKKTADNPEGFEKGVTTDVFERMDAMQEAEDALKAFKTLHNVKDGKISGTSAEKEVFVMSDDQKKAQADFDEADKIFQDAKTKRDSALKLLKEIMPKNSGTGAGAGSGDHTPKWKYRDAQVIRKMLSEGKTNAEICAEIGCNAANINYYKNYLQFPLRKAPEGTDMTTEESILLYTAWLPLINSYYPAKWLGEDGKTIYSGAPLQGEDSKGSNKFHYAVKKDLSEVAA